LLLTGVFFVVAYGTNDPATFGHSGGEVDVTIDGTTKTLQQAIGPDIQRRVSGTCNGQVVVGVNEDGTVNCEADNTGGGSPAGCTFLKNIGVGTVVAVTVPAECKGNFCTLLLTTSGTGAAFVHYIQQIPGVSDSGRWIAQGVWGVTGLASENRAETEINGGGFSGVIVRVTSGSLHVTLSDDGSGENSINSWWLTSSGTGGNLYSCTY